MADSPATKVSTMPSMTIWNRMSKGVAPMALRMPISMVRSFTTTIMMLLTPMAPASRVPIPTNHIKKFTPLKRLSMILKIGSMLSIKSAWSSSGAMVCFR